MCGAWGELIFSYFSVLINTGVLPNVKKTHVTNTEFTYAKNKIRLSCCSVLCFDKTRPGGIQPSL